jgi:hypothetical protein
VHYSAQKWFCQVCGVEQHEPIANASYHARVCGKKCWHEWEWRRVLSVLGKEYYPDNRPYDADGDLILTRKV